MELLIISLLGWAGHLALCYFVIRRISSFSIRVLSAFTPCLILTVFTCHDLPEFRATSMFTVAICWMVSIRLLQLTILPWDHRLTFTLFLSKILWTFLPLVSCEKDTHLGWIIARDVSSIIAKMLLCHWTYRWLLQCEPSDSPERMCLFYLLMITIPFAADLEGLLIRIFTKNRYTIEEFTHHVFFSRSLRIFWGKRYNRVVNHILKESIFRPINNHLNSAALAALATFIVSGIFHVHLVLVLFDDISYVIPTFLFFLFHGIACCLEKNITMEYMEHIGWLITHFFLLLTAPLVLRPFVFEKSFLNLNPPPLIDVPWIPKLPVPQFCLK